jgi:hypothetical protein
LRIRFAAGSGYLTRAAKWLAAQPTAINMRFLKQYPAYCDFIGKTAATPDGEPTGEAVSVEERRTPLELIDAAYKSLRPATAEDLVSSPPPCVSAAPTVSARLGRPAAEIASSGAARTNEDS